MIMAKGRHTGGRPRLGGTPVKITFNTTVDQRASVEDLFPGMDMGAALRRTIAAGIRAMNQERETV
jgi:hypothetical protein